MAEIITSDVGALKASVDNSIITQTLDKTNSSTGKIRGKYAVANQFMDNTYDFSKAVLSAAYDAKGAIFSGES